MIRPEDVDPIADQIIAGGPACSEQLLDELTRRCMPLLCYIRERFGFSCIPMTELRSQLAVDAVSDAVVERQHRGGTILKYLVNRFRDHCRRFMKDHRLKSIEEIHSQLELENPQVLNPATAAQCDPREEAMRAEQVELILKELAREDRRCQRIVRAWARGASFTEVASLHDDLSADRCRYIHHENLSQVRIRLQWRYPGSFDGPQP